MSEKAKQLIENICPQCGYEDDSEIDDVEWDDHDNDFDDEPYDDMLSAAAEPEDDFDDDDEVCHDDDDDFAEPEYPVSNGYYFEPEAEPENTW